MIMARIKEGLGSETHQSPPSFTSGLAAAARQAGIWSEYRVDGKGVKGIFTLPRRLQGSLVYMIRVSIPTSVHSWEVDECYVVWCILIHTALLYKTVENGIK